MTDKCEHGAERESHKQWPEGLGFTEPLNPCSCCGTLFYYIESWSCSVDDDGTITGGGKVYEPKDRCAQCGGHYRHEGASDEEIGWEVMCDICHKFFPESKLESHECVVGHEKENV